jgi:hypothetical protein
MRRNECGREVVAGWWRRAMWSCGRATPLHIGCMRNFRINEIFTAFLFAAGLAVGCTTDGEGDDEDGGTDNTARIASTCQSYCAKAQTCDDDDGTVEQCVADCKANLGDCMVDEQGAALDDLDGCAAESCDDFGACTIGAGLQCTFGI